MQGKPGIYSLARSDRITGTSRADSGLCLAEIVSISTEHFQGVGQNTALELFLHLHNRQDRLLIID